MVAQGWGWEQGLIGNGHKKTFWGDRNVKNPECGGCKNSANLLNINELYIRNLNLVVCK